MSRPTPPAYKTRNWPAYNEALKRRGSLTIWFDTEMIWEAKPTGKRGRQPVYSDPAIQTCLTMTVLFGMALRQTTGFVESLLRLIDLDWTVPNFSTLSRRQKTLKVNIPYRGSQGPLHLLIDSTGIKVEGEGEWNARKHGGTKRRVWRKIHIGIDEQTLEIRAAELTSSDVGDAPMLPELLDQIPPDQEIASVTADGAFDTRKCHDAIGNPFEGAATAAGAAAADAFSAALSQTYLEPPDLGLGAMADDARGRADGYREAAGMLADAAGRPLASWQALRHAVTGTGTEAETALADAANSADALNTELDETLAAAGSAGAAARDAGAEAAAGADQAATGWGAVTAALADYASKARDIGGDIGQALVGAFTSAENAVGEFVKTGKLDFRDLVTSMIADLAKLAARTFILGPIASALSGALGGAGGIFANILHAGGMVGSPGPGRMVPALAFANAPRMHAGGWAGIKPDEVPAILQRGERVLSRREAAGYGQGQSAMPAVNVTINARDAESFRQSRTQVAADIARAVSLGRRGM